MGCVDMNEIIFYLNKEFSLLCSPLTLNMERLSFYQQSNK